MHIGVEVGSMVPRASGITPERPTVPDFKVAAMTGGAFACPPRLTMAGP